MNTAVSETVIARIVNPTSADPSNDAFSGSLPISMCRTMFSSITMASSTTKPTASVSAIRERLSSENPSRYITANVPMRDIGNARLGMIVAEMFRRKTKMTMTTRNSVSISVNFTSPTDSSIESDRS